MYNNSSLPKLLAKENITIRHGNYKTPWFDIKNRVLGLPMWKDMGKDIYDLFVGHEVGHALETPYEGWHDSPEKLQGCPRSYINVIEDARIERKIKSRYPGLVGPFSRAYATLFTDNFFGTDEHDVRTLRIIDKINLQAKVGSHIDIEFNDEEQVFMDRANTTEDFQEVLELVKDIVAYDKTQEEEEEEKPETQTQTNDDSDDDFEENEGDSSSSDDGNTSEKDENAPSSTSADDEDEDEDAQDPMFGQGHGGKEAVTDQAFRKNESSLVDLEDDQYQTLHIEDINKVLRKKIVVDYKQLKAERDERLIDLHAEIVEELANSDAAFPKYMKDAKRSVGIAVKEFEMRKAATQWQKATTAKTGVIDVNKLYSYRTNEDIFKQTTRLHDAKNHGMMMLIDYSGSMYESLPKVLEQLIHLVLFCKQVNIPFDVYAFTTGNRELDYAKLRSEGLLFDGDLDLDDISMPLLTSSKLKKSDFIDSIKALHARACSASWIQRSVIGRSEEFGSTPLNQALIVAHHLIKEFKAKNQIEKMNLIVFSDGDANRVHSYSDSSMSDNKIPNRGSWRGVTMMIDGRLVNTSGGNDITRSLLNNIRKRLDTTTIGFFMADDNRMFNHKIDDVSPVFSEDARRNAQKEYRKNKCVVRKDVIGYNEFYLVKGGNNLDVANDDFEVSADQTKGQMANAFKKFSKSKKQNKVLMTTFGRAVA